MNNTDLHAGAKWTTIALTLVLLTGPAVAGTTGPQTSTEGVPDLAETPQPNLGDRLLAQDASTDLTAEPVQASDLEGAIERLANAAGHDLTHRDTEALEPLEQLDAEQEAALASIVAASAASIEQRQAAVNAPLALTPATEALLGSSADLLATIQTQLEALQAADIGTQATQTSEPDVNVPGVLAIDLGGDTTYRTSTTLKIDLAGDDTHLDSAGGAAGGCFIPCPDTSISIDASGDDTYDHNADADKGPRLGAQGAARGYFALGVLVDGDGDDTYTVEGELLQDQGPSLSRLSQGSAAAYGVGVLGDLRGDDTYETTYTNIPDRQNRPDCAGVPCDYWIGAQGASFQDRGTLDPGWGVLVDTDGNDTYSADIGPFPAQGALDHFPSTFDTVLEQGTATLLDLGGSDVYEGSTFETLNHYNRHAVKGTSTENFVDTDADQPSVRVLEPNENDVVVDEASVTVRARDLADLAGADVRGVDEVEVSIGSATETLAWPADDDTATITVDVSGLDAGVYTLTATATNDRGQTASQTIDVQVANS